MKKILLSILLLILPMLASAYDCQVDGIYYNLIPKGNVAEVTYQKYIPYYYQSDYSGTLNIPESFTYNGVEYSVTTIGDYAFYDCSSLTSVTIPNSVTTLGNYAFRGCSSLTSVTIPNSVTSIGNNAFQYCSGLTTITIPESMASIGDYAFEGCNDMTSVNITNLEAWCKIDFKSNPLSFAHHLYCNGEEIKDLVIPNTVTTIKSRAFTGCDGLTSVTIPTSVTSIGVHSFSYCSGLISMTIPNSVTNIEQFAFSCCNSLTSVTIPNSMNYIPYGAFYNCSGLTSVTIPNSVMRIEKYAFYNCSGLTMVTIPESVNTIGESTFESCSSLTMVTIGNSIMRIDSRAFAGCNKLEEVYCYAKNVPQTNTNAFEKSYPEYSTLYVPATSLNGYKTTMPWSEFGTIIAIPGTGEEPLKCATPTISYADKKLSFSCETEGVEFFSEIKDVDIKKFCDASIDLSAIYEISVYATKSGYVNSDVATATLVWSEAIFTETTPDTPTSAKAVTESIPVLISANNGNILVKSKANGQSVAVYSVDGQLLGNTTVSNGQATVPTTLQNRNVAVVKVGNKSVKVLMR